MKRFLLRGPLVGALFFTALFVWQLATASMNYMGFSAQSSVLDMILDNYLAVVVWAVAKVLATHILIGALVGALLAGVLWSLFGRYVAWFKSWVVVGCYPLVGGRYPFGALSPTMDRTIS